MLRLLSRGYLEESSLRERQLNGKGFLRTVAEWLGRKFAVFQDAGLQYDLYYMII